VVLVRGTAHHVDTEAERASDQQPLALSRWVEAEPEHFIPGHSDQHRGPAPPLGMMPASGDFRNEAENSQPLECQRTHRPRPPPRPESAA